MHIRQKCLVSELIPKYESVNRTPPANLLYPAGSHNTAVQAETVGRCKSSDFNDQSPVRDLPRSADPPSHVVTKFCSRGTNCHARSPNQSTDGRADFEDSYRLECTDSVELVWL